MVDDKATMIINASVLKLADGLVDMIDDCAVSRCPLQGLSDHDKRKKIALGIAIMKINQSVCWN